MFDLHNNINPMGIAATGVITVTDNTAIVSGIVDRQGYEAIEFVIATGTLADADATFTTLIEEGDDSGLSDAAAVADIDLLGTEALASFTFAEDASAFKIGYIGNKRYVRCTVTPANNTGSAPIAIIALGGRLHDAPSANPPA
jgi:hypothetical protein